MNPLVKANFEDVTAIMGIFKECTEALLKANIRQWDGTYPITTIFEKDIKAGNVFLIKKEAKVLATITLNDQQDDQYKAIKWRFKSEKVLVIHRLAVNLQAQGRGFGKLLCEFSETYGLEKGFEVIRLDAYSGNPISCSVYEKLDYHRAEGLCWFHGNELPFYCFEKKLF